MKVYILFHEYGNGRSAEVFKNKNLAENEFKKILKDYKKDGIDIDVNSKNDSELFDTTGCSLSIVESNLRD